MSPQVQIELEQLLAALCDDCLGETQHARLEQLLTADADCRRHYLEYLDVHARLLGHPDPMGRESLLAAARELVEPDPAAPRRRRRWVMVARYGAVIASTLAASFLIQVGWSARRDGGGKSHPPAAVDRSAAEAVATLAEAADCVWDGPGDPPRAGGRLPAGALRLARGVARLRFDSGPELLVQGPASVRLDAVNAATLLAGKVVFRADDTAPPFELHTPTSTLVDLGTEYAVSVTADTEEVHVFEGEVRRMPRSPVGAEPEQLGTGEARRYARGIGGEPIPLDPAKFVRKLPQPGRPWLDSAGALLAYEGFDYPEADAMPNGRANGGTGWAGGWNVGFCRGHFKGDHPRPALNSKEGLARSSTTAGGCLDCAGFGRYYRRLAAPVRLDEDGVYYLSYLFKRQGPPADAVNALVVLLRPDDDNPLSREDFPRRLYIGVGGPNHLFTHVAGASSRVPLPLTDGETYLLVAKIVAGRSRNSQVFVRVYGPAEPVDREEPALWTSSGPPFRSDLVFQWVEVHVNSKRRQQLDELRLGTTWAAVTAPWTAKSGKP